MSDPRTFVIVGAGQAGRWLALTLREAGFAGRIVWFGDEPHRPYDRPPLSKAVLKGAASPESLGLIDEARFAALDVDFRPNQRVVAIDRAARTVRTGSGSTLGYDTLFLATGGTARALPGMPPHPRVLTLRSIADAFALKARLDVARQVVVIGGGWIGLEVAASARQLGREVTLIEAAPRLAMRTVPPCVSEHLAALHRGHGVDLRLGDGVAAVEAHDEGVSVHLASGAVVVGDVLVAGIGLVANDRLAAEAGLAVDNGVLTDAWGRTEDPAIFAVGDVANPLRGSTGTRLRIESWENAERMAIAAARAALGLEHDAEAAGPPWFWSDQYDDNVQLLGLPDASMTVIERHIADRPDKRAALFFFCDGPRVKALAAVNAGREIKIVRKWIREGRFPADLGALANPALDIHKLPLIAPDGAAAV